MLSKVASSKTAIVFMEQTPFDKFLGVSNIKNIRYYNRELQLNDLRETNSATTGVFEVVVGRRRVGKARLI